MFNDFDFQIAIKTPSKSVVDDYLNEDNYYSFRLFACTGPNLEFYEIITRWPGASHENKIFNLSEMYQRFEFTTKMDGVLLANERYSCTNFVMTPIEVANEPNQTLDSKYRRYNAAHRKTYSFFEAIKLLKGRFRCLQNVLACQDGEFTNKNYSLNAFFLVFNMCLYFRNGPVDNRGLCGASQHRDTAE